MLKAKPEACAACLGVCHFSIIYAASGFGYVSLSLIPVTAGVGCVPFLLIFVTPGFVHTDVC